LEVDLRESVVKQRVQNTSRTF